LRRFCPRVHAQVKRGSPANARWRAVRSPGLAGGGGERLILFDTSNYSSRFAFAQDAIADFVRSLDTADKIALAPIVATFASRRCARSRPGSTRRTTVAGDEAALANTLLFTLRDVS
jgi:hypothetical protein